MYYKDVSNKHEDKHKLLNFVNYIPDKRCERYRNND